MANDDTVEIRFTGEVTDLLTKLALAKTEFASLKKTIEEWSSIMLSSGKTAAASMEAELTKMVTRAAVLDTTISSLSGRFRELSAASQTISSPVGLQNYSNFARTLDQDLQRLVASERVVDQSLAAGSIGATQAAQKLAKLADETRRLNEEQGRYKAVAVQAAGTAGVDQAIAKLHNLKDTQDKVTASNSELARQWKLTQGVMEVKPATQFWNEFNERVGIANKSVGSLRTTSTSLSTVFKDLTEQGGHLTFSMTRVSRELIVIAHEVVSGQFNRIPGSFMVLAEAAGGLTLSMIAMAAAIIVPIAAATFLSIKLIELNRATERVQIGAVFSGNMELTNSAIRSTIFHLEWFGNLSQETATKVVGAFARMRGVTDADMKAMSTATFMFSQATGEDAGAAAQKLTGLVNAERVSFQQLQDMFPGATALQIAHTAEVLRSGDAHQRLAETMRLLQGNLAQTKEEWVALNSGMFHSFHNFFALLTPIELAKTMITGENRIVAENTALWEHNNEILAKSIEAKRKQALSFDEVIGAAMRAGESENSYRANVDIAKKHIADLEEGIRRLAVSPYSDAFKSEQIKKFNEDLVVARGNLERMLELQRRREDFGVNLHGQEVIRKGQTAVSEINADQDVGAAERLKAITKVWADILAGEKLTAKQREEVTQEMNRSIAAAAKAVGVEEVQQAKLKSAEIRADQSKSAAEQLAEVRAVWTAVLNSDKLTAQQRVNVEREAVNEIKALERSVVQEQDAIGRNHLHADIEIGRERLRQRREELEELVQLGDITDQEKLISLRAFAEEEGRLAIEGLEITQRAYRQESEEFQRLEDQKRVERARTASELARLDRQIAQSYNREQLDEIRINRRKVDTILAAENSLIDDLFSGQQTLKMSLLRATDAFLKQELIADAKYITQRLLIRETGHKADIAMEQGGFLAHLLFGQKKVLATTAEEAQKTGATAVGTATRTTMKATEAAAENAGFLVRVVRWIASELGMTSATTTGEATRTAEKTAANATILTETLAANVALAESYAALSAIEAAASVAAIPYIGWVMAPGVAAEQFAAMQTFVGMAALDVGAWEIPKNMPAYLHSGEMVVPKTYAQGLRESASTQTGGFHPSLTSNINRAPDINLFYQPSIHAPEQPNLARLVEKEAAFMKNWVHGLMRSGSLRVARE